MKTIGVIGLGRIGMVAARTYVENGYEVYGYDCRDEAMEELESFGGIAAQNPAAVGHSSETVLILVLNDSQVEAVITGNNALLDATSKPSLVICMSTINRSNLERFDTLCSAQGIGFVDCPFTGGPARVESGTLTIIGAGQDTLLSQASTVLSIIGELKVVGDKPGMGQAVKHCNQLLVTAVHGATIELIALAKKSGADPKQVCEIVGAGIAGNDYFKLLSRGILEETDSPGGMGQLWKDINLVVTTAREHNLPLLSTFATAQYFNMAVAQGMENEDSARLMNLLDKMISSNP